MKYRQPITFALGVGCLTGGIGALHICLWASLICLLLGCVLAGLWMAGQQQGTEDHRESIIVALETQREVLKQVAQEQSDFHQSYLIRQDKTNADLEGGFQCALESMDQMQTCVENTMEEQRDMVEQLCEDLENDVVDSHKAVEKALKTMAEQQAVQQEKLEKTMERMSNQYETFQQLSEKMVAELTLMSQEDQKLLGQLVQG